MSSTPDTLLSRSIKSAFVILISFSGLVVLFNTMFVLPQFLEKKHELFVFLEKSRSPDLEKIQNLLPLKMIDWAAIPADFAIKWWFVFLPLLTVFPLLVPAKVRESAAAQMTFLGGFALFGVFFVYLQGIFIGLGGAILLTFLKW